MKKCTLLIVTFIVMSFFGFAKVQSGIFLSLKDYGSVMDFSDNKLIKESEEITANSFCVKFANISPKKFEFNITVSLSNVKDIKIDENIGDFTQTGIGAELGKIINIAEFKIFKRPSSVDMVCGISGMIYFNRKYKDPELIDELSERRIFYDFGFYASFRTSLMISKIDFHAGFQLDFPFYSTGIPFNEAMALTKSYIFTGITF